jgi:ABC-type multidrug transport system fused ATPase/permease subunit
MNLLNPFGANANLARIARRYLWAVPVVALLAIVTGLLEGFGVSLLIPFLATLTHSSAAPGGGALAVIARFAQGYSRDGRLLLIAVTILLSTISKNALRTVQAAFTSWVDGHLSNDIRCALSFRLESVGYAFFLAHDPGRLASIFGPESAKASAAVKAVLNRIAATAGTFIFGMMLFVVSWRLSLMVLAGGLLARTAQKYLEVRIRKFSRRTVASNHELTNRMLAAIFGARVIRLFHHQEAEHARFAVSSNEVRRATLKVEAVAGGLGPLLEAMHNLLFLTVMMIAVFTGESLPVLAAFLVLMNRLQPHLRVLEQSGADFASAAGQLSEVEWLLDAHGKPPAPGGDLVFPGLRSSIAFEDVTFGYMTRGAEPALAGASFVLRHGRATALIGESGAGKSTAVNLLCRLLEPSSGVIKVDGQPLSQFQVAGWLSSIAVAGQDVDLIDGTIAENISYGLESTERSPDRSRIENAARMAKADFIADLPLGLDTMVGTRGLSLSGGQRQRIGIARALARDPAILILDEATNAIDHETEAAIIRSLQELPKSMTILVISHRPATLAFCDDAVVFQSGRVVDSGPLSATLSYRAMQLGNMEISASYASSVNNA